MSGPLLVVSVVHSELKLLPHNPAAPPRTPPTSFGSCRFRHLTRVRPDRPADQRSGNPAAWRSSRSAAVNSGFPNHETKSPLHKRQGTDDYLWILRTTSN